MRLSSVKKNFKSKLKNNNNKKNATADVHKKKKKTFRKNLKDNVNLNSNSEDTPLVANLKNITEDVENNDKVSEFNEKLDKGHSQLQTTGLKRSKRHKKKQKNLGSAEKRVDSNTAYDKEREKAKAEINDDKNERTVFVGNVGISTKKEQLLKAFRLFGKIESIRLRGITPADPKTPKRLAAIKRTFHPKRTSLHSYIVFESRDDALKAIELNGTKLNEHFIRVQLCDDNIELEPTKAIFIGNLPFDTEENDLWNTFEEYGKIVSVRLVRNSETGMCIGIGFVNFESSDAVELVLMADSVTIKNRELRIQRYSKTKVKKSEGNRRQRFKAKPESKAKEKEIKKAKTTLSTGGSDKKDLYQGSKFAQRKRKQRRIKRCSKI